MVLYVTEISENISEDILENRMSLLCSNRLKKALGYRNYKDRIRSVAAGLLLQQGVKDSLAETGKQVLTDTEGRIELQIQEKENGKPYLLTYPDLFFSISHSGSLVGCVFAETEIGFDLQQIRSCKQELLIKKFHPDEQAYYFSRNLEDRTEVFFRLWAIKEAYVKYTGKGLSEGFSGFRVDWQTQNICDSQNNPVAKFMEFSCENKDYYCAIVAKNTVELRKITEIKF